MKRNYTISSFFKRMYLLTAIGLFLLGQVNAANTSIDKLFEHIASQNKGATLLLSANQQNPLDIKLTVTTKECSLADFVAALQKSAGNNAFFNIALDDELKKIGGITIDVKDVPLKEILEKVLTPKGLTYSVKGNVFIILKAPQKPKANTENKIDVAGTVYDAETKKPIAGATIIVLNTSNGAISDENGKFSFSAVENSQIEVSYIGMKSVVLTLEASNPVFVVNMEQDAIAVDDVIVTGIFTKAKESYTGAVTSVSAKDMKMYRGQNVLATLKNIDPSLNVAINNDLGSNPNALPEVTIRGNSSLPQSVKELNETSKRQLNAPLVIMDGFEVSLQKLMDFCDEEIESINILKDASATAIYGSRGANGVIVVNTKVPTAGKMKIFFQTGINLEIPDLTTYNLMNSREKLDIENMYGVYTSDDAKQNVILQKQYNKFHEDVLRGLDTYWIGEPVRIGLGQKYNLRLEGGNSAFRWSTSVGYNKVEGAMKGSSRDNFSGAVTLSYSLKNVIFKNQTNVTTNKGKESNYGKFSEYAKMNPYWKIRDENGEIIREHYYYGKNSLDPTKVGNPIYNASLKSIDEQKYTEIINNFSIEWNIVNSLKMKAQLGLYKSFNSSDKYISPDDTKYKDYTGDDFVRKGEYSYKTGETFNYDGNITLSYNKLFAEKHQLYVGLDYSISERNYFDYVFMGEGFSNEDMYYINNAYKYPSEKSPTGTDNITRRMGFTGNANYTYNNRYFADLSYRIDGSSQFGSKNRFAPFWSIGLGWNLHREDFLKDSKIINNLRLRGSYGQVGSQQFEAYQAMSTLRYYPDNRYIIWNAAELMELGNENLKWQITDQINVGAEVGILGNRLSASLDVYSKKTSNLLSQMALPLTTGFPSYVENVGEVKNVGYEAMLSGYVIRDLNRNIIWSVTGKLAYNKNTIVNLSEAIKKQTEEYKRQNVDVNKLLYEGFSQNSIYAVPSLGIDPSTGQEVFLNMDGRAIKSWNPRDKRYAGVSEPKYRGNISSLFSYKNLTLNLSFGFHWGGQQYNQTLINKVEVTNNELRLNVDERVLSERWHKSGDVKFFKGISDTKTKMSTRFVMDDNVFQLQSASLEYRLQSPKLLENAKIQTINFGVNMSDVFYASTIKRERGIEYPFAKRVLFTVSFLF